jgi:hypothetical protein
MGILDIKDPAKQQALMAMGSSLMNSGGYSRTPVSFGQALGQGMGAYTNKLDEYKQKKLQEKLQAMQMEQAAMSLEQAKASSAWQKGAGIYGAPDAAIESVFKAPDTFDKKMALAQTNPQLYGTMYPSAQTNIYNGNPPLPTDQQILRDDLIANAQRARESVMQNIKQGDSSTLTITNLNKALGLLDKVETGSLEETKIGLSKFAKSLGIDVDVSKISNAEQLMVLLGDEVMARVGETKGAVSEKEMDLFTRYSANFGNTVEGNRKILQFKLAKAKRDQKIASIARTMMDQKKPSTEIERAILKHINENPLTDYLEDPVSEFDKIWGSK